MIRKNMMNILLGAVVVAAGLVGYNAFVASSDNGQTATSRVSSYLSLDAAVQESTEGSVATNTSSTEQTITSTATTAESQTVTVAPSTTTDSSVAVTQSPATTTATAPSTSSPTVASSPTGDRVQTTYTVKDGDTYGCIAEKYYGSYEHWVDVVNANPVGNVGFTEYGLHVGAQIVLPAVGTASLKPSSALCS